MTKITRYKLFLGFASFAVFFVVIVANLAIEQKKSQKRFIAQIKPLIKSPPIKRTPPIERVDTFLHFSYILNESEELLKEKLISRYRLSVDKAEQYTKAISRVSSQYDIPSDLLAALIRTESNYYSQAVSHKNAIGPTQIIAKYWKKDCAADLFNIDNNIQCAAIILTRYKKSCRGDWDCTLAMYNVGPRNYYKKNKFYQRAGMRYLLKINKNLKLLNG